MLTENDYQQFVLTLREESRLEALRPWGPIWARVWASDEDPEMLIQQSMMPPRIHITPFLLVRMWHADWIRAISVEVPEWLAAEKTRCVFKCPDGEVQESRCSETTDDYLHCWAAVRGSCKG
jgi:hypothetical protein